MKSLLSSIAFATLLLHGGLANAQTAPVAIPCNPSCAPNQVCATNGQCMYLVAAEQTPPTAPVEPVPSTRRNSTGMMVGGIVLTGGGGALALTGLMYMALGSVGCVDSGSTYSSSCEDSAKTVKNIGLVMAVGGGLMTVAGIPLIIVGAKRVPNTDPDRATSLTFRATPRAELLLLPAGLSLRGSF